MAKQTLNSQNSGGGGFFSWLGIPNYNVQDSTEGDANIKAAGLINVPLTKKEMTIQDQRSLTNQNSYQTDNSVTTTTTTSDNRAFSYTNAPTLVFNSPNANVSGSKPSFSASPSFIPTLDLSRAMASIPTATTSQAAEATKTNGLDLNKIALYAALAGGAYLLLGGGKKVVMSTPQAKAVKKVAGSKSKK